MNRFSVRKILRPAIYDKSLRSNSFLGLRDRKHPPDEGPTAKGGDLARGQQDSRAAPEKAREERPLLGGLDFVSPEWGGAAHVLVRKDEPLHVSEHGGPLGRQMVRWSNRACGFWKGYVVGAGMLRQRSRLLHGEVTRRISLGALGQRTRK